MNGTKLEIAKLGVEGAIALVLIVAMTWIIVSPAVTDEVSKAALVIIGSAIGFLFGRNTK